LVTGAAGFIGSHLCEALLARGDRIVGIDSFEPTYPRAHKQLNLSAPAGHEAFAFHEGDVVDAPLAELLEGVDCVFHIAAKPGVRDSWSGFDDYLRSNLAATKALLDACVGRAIRVVYASSSSVYGNPESFPVTEDAPLHPLSPYGATKVATEALANAYWSSQGVDVVGLRYFTAYGPRQRPDMALARFIDAAERGEELPVFGDGRQMRDFTYVADIVAGTIAAAERGRAGAAYNIASGNPVPLLDVLDALGAALDRPLALRFDPAPPGESRDTWGDTSRARDELGYAPTVGLVEGLSAQVAETQRRRAAIPVA
jgi:nucleoside-diphosphate-sugar epimerase